MVDPSTSLTLIRAMQEPETREAAWAAFVGRYEPLLREWARRAGRDGMADEVVAIVLAKLLACLSSYDPERPFRPWLRAILRNAARDIQRAEARVPGAVGLGGSGVIALMAEAPDDSGEIDRLVERVQEEYELARRVAVAVEARVAGTHWQAFVLSQVDGSLDGDQIAARVGLPSRQAVYTAVYRVRRLIDEERRRADAAGGVHHS